MQLAVRELESGQKVRDPKLVAFDVLCAGETSRSRVGEGEHPDHEQESQRAPLDDLGPILFGAVLVLERERQAQRELPLVRAGHHRLLQNPDRYDDTRPKQRLAGAAVFAHGPPWGMTGSDADLSASLDSTDSQPRLHAQRRESPRHGVRSQREDA